MLYLLTATGNICSCIFVYRILWFSFFGTIMLYITMLHVVFCVAYLKVAKEEEKKLQRKEGLLSFL